MTGPSIGKTPGAKDVGLGAVDSLMLLVRERLDAVSATLELRHNESAMLVDLLSESAALRHLFIESWPLEMFSLTLVVLGRTSCEPRVLDDTGARGQCNESRDARSEVEGLVLGGVSIAPLARDDDEPWLDDVV